MTVGFALPGTHGRLFQSWNGGQSNLEEEVFFHDWFQDSEWSDERPLVLNKDGGLMGFFSMEGLDPEPLGQGEYNAAAAAVRRAMDLFQLESIDSAFAGGTWVIQNYLERVRTKVPPLAPLERESRALEFLRAATDRHWSGRPLFDDRITWVVQFHPAVKSEVERWKARVPDYYREFAREWLEAQAAMVRRQCSMFDNALTAFSTDRPKQGFGVQWMGREEVRSFLWRQVNRREDDPPPEHPYLSLAGDLCLSSRSNKDRYQRVNDQFIAVLTFKNPPCLSKGNMMACFQEHLNFPYTLVHTWAPFDPLAKKKEIDKNKGPSATLRTRSRVVAEWDAEAEEFIGALQVDVATPFHWKFSAIVTAPGDELKIFEDRVAKFYTWLKTFAGAEPLVEGKTLRDLAEISSLPGSGFMNKRQNIITALNCGDLAFTFRASTGIQPAHLVFGTRRSGYYGYNLFDPRLPSWNSAVLGLPGSGKSVLMNMEAMGLAGYPSQIYIIDIGNSYGRLFDWLQKEMPGMVSVMRFGADSFNFNPFPLVWALREREKQKADGTYLKDLGGGEFLRDPVEEAKVFFQGWLDLLVGQGKAVEPEMKNKLDRALKGGDGKSGFFLDYEHYCQALIEQEQAGMKVHYPEPLTSLLTFVRQEAAELEGIFEFWTRNPQKQYFDSGKDSFSGTKACYFEVTGLDEQKEVVRPFVGALMGLIWRRITDPRNLKERKVIIIDEAWKFLADPAFAPVIEGFFRTARKHNCFVILSTQTPNDLKSPEAIKLLRTMAHQFLYKGFDDPEYLAGHLKMSEAQIELHQSLRQDNEVREVLHVDQNGDCRVLRVDLNPWQYWMVTTNAQDKVIWSRFFAHYGSEEAAMDALAEATGYKTIPGELLRVRLVQDYARKHNIP